MSGQPFQFSAVPLMHSLIALALLCLTCAASAGGDGVPADYYVATNGNNTWSGKLAAPNRSRTDGPFATLARAQQALRAHRPAGPSRVAVRGGVYFLANTLTFTPEDSGTTAAPITYVAYPGEHPVLSGGSLIAGWRIADGGRWEATLPDVQSDAWNFAQLFVNNGRRYRPRLPRAGYYTIAGDVAPSEAAQGKGCDRF